MKKIVLSILTISCLGSIAQNVTIPDANFKAALVANQIINDNGDSEIQVSEANNYMGALNVSQLNITDLTGIEEFTNIFNLNCSQNSISTFDLSNNTALTSLSLHFNQFTSIDVSALTNLTFIECSNNSIEELDLSNNVNLTNIRATNNSLTSFNVKNGNNTNVTLFRAQNNSNLACIEVDDATHSSNNWTNIDATTSFSTNCTTSVGVLESKNRRLTTYPNPTNGIITFSTEVNIKEIEVYNSMGQKVKNYSANNQIDISDLPNGIYTAKINLENNEKIIKQIKKN